MTPRGAALKLKRSSAYQRLTRLVGVKGGNASERRRITGLLIRELDGAADAIRVGINPEQQEEFEEQLWREMEFYCLLSAFYKEGVQSPNQG